MNNNIIQSTFCCLATLKFIILFYISIKRYNLIYKLGSVINILMDKNMMKTKVIGTPRIDAKAEYLDPIDFSFKDLMNLQSKIKSFLTYLSFLYIN